MLFSLGQVVATPDVVRAIPKKELTNALFAKHALGDWGNVCDEDKKENNYSLNRELRLFSSYKSKNDIEFWIITEADRSATTILLPEEY